MNKIVAIAGYGIEGQSAHRYYTDQGYQVMVFDDDPRALRSVPVRQRGGDIAELILNIARFDVISRTPSINPAKLKGSRLLSSTTNEFFAHCRAPIIGVTGTKGKGTTCSLITAILREAGANVRLLGNIGETVLDKLNTIETSDTVVYELSSFQLWDMRFSPHIAVVLMVEPDHLDVHDSLDDYLNAKANITKHQRPLDIVIYHPTNKQTAQIASFGSAKRKIRYSTDEGATIRHGKIVINEQIICSTDDIKIIGPHNLENICAASTAAWQITKDIPAYKRAISQFEGLPHRLQKVAEFNEVQFYDDSIATNPSSAVAALKSFKRPTIIILGGWDKKARYDQLAKEMKLLKTKQAILIGKTAPDIAAALKKSDYSDYQIASSTSMDEIVRLAWSFAGTGDVILLSPACASFDMFKDYKERGAAFLRAVQKLARN